MAADAPKKPEADRTTAAGDETVNLSPFEVKADSDSSYGALNSNSLTAFRTALDHVPVTADIMTQTFMNDVAMINVEAGIQAYDAGAQFGGLNVANASQNQPGDHLANGSLRLRGSPIGGMQINGLLIAGSIGNPGGTSFGSTSNYDLERVEIINGPQALLFAGGGPGGVINLVTKQARLNQPTFGTLSFRVDQFGSKYATADFGASKRRLAVRFAQVDSTTNSRRVNIGDHLKGNYFQFAYGVGNSVLRLSLQQSVSDRLAQHYASVTSGTGDPLNAFNGYHLEYLLATGRAAPFVNGGLNWNNVQSFDGQWNGDKEVAEMGSIALESKWSKWLSTELSVAAGNFNDDQMGGSSTINFYTPASTANPLPGNWTMGMPQSGTPVSDTWRPKHNKAIRFSAILTNDFFDGRAHSMTNFAADYTGNINAIYPYSFYQADSSGNIVINPALNATAGRALIPTQAWTVNNGPVRYALFNPGVQQITLNGVNYVRQMVTPLSKALVTPANPLGQIIPANTSNQLNGNFHAGYAIVNYTQWLGGKFDTLTGVRFNHQKSWIVSTPLNEDIEARTPDFSVGATYHVRPWLAPYVSFSDVYSNPPSGTFTQAGLPPPICHGLGGELGLKLNADDGKISGSLSYYENLAKGEEFNGGAGITNYVNVNGLNGRPTNGASLALDVRTSGFTAAITAAPNANWRMRLSAAETSGKFNGGVGFRPFYNDQFYATSSGQVTYADGTAVFVPATFNRNQLTVSAGSAGAVPLTVTLLSTPGSQYFAAPQPVTGAILKTSNGGLVLLSPQDPAHGAIITGKAGLPISSYQLNPALSGVTPVNTIYAVQAGNQTWGYPQFSFNYTTTYSFSEGWLKGAKLGGTGTLNWRSLASYYYPNGFTGANFSEQTRFYLPPTRQLDLIAGYGHKFGRYTWSTQVNVNNVINRYRVVIYPDVVTGWTVPASLTANLVQQPRSYVWTNTFSF